MKQKLPYVLGGIIVILIIAASLNSGTADTPEDTSPDSKVAGTKLTEENFDELFESYNNNGDGTALSLTAQAIGECDAELSWTVPTDMEGSQFRIVRGPFENPVYPGNYWYHQGSERREITWEEIPVRQEHFRICQFVDGVCVAYSNNVTVDIYD